MQKTISEMALFMKSLLPLEIPGIYAVNPMFENISDENTIRKGILAYRDFLYVLYDNLTANGNLYDKPLDKREEDDAHHVSLKPAYPFIYYIQNVLFNLGYHGELTNDNAIIVENWKTLTMGILYGKWQSKDKVSTLKLVDCLKLLSNCGIHIVGTDLETAKPFMSKPGVLEISYPDNPDMLIGLKVMAIANKELTVDKEIENILLRCDYRVVKNEKTDMVSFLKDTMHSLSADVQNFILNLHQRYIEEGMKCILKASVFGISFTYFHKNKEVWMFSTAINTGRRILIKANRTHEYTDVIGGFPLHLQEKIAKGYGCEKKKYGEPCRKGCHGFSFVLDDSILDISRNIEIWIDNELSCLRGKAK